MTTQSIKDLKDDLGKLSKEHKLTAILQGIHYDEMVRITSLFITSKYPTPVHIEDSKICQSLGNIDFFVKIHMTTVINSDVPEANIPKADDPTGKPSDTKDPKPINLKFKCSKRDIKLLRSIKHADAVAIIFDQDQKIYIFTDGKSVIELEQSEYKELPSPPTLSGKSVGVAVSVSPDQMTLFKSKTKTVILELYNDQLENIILNGSVKQSISRGNVLTLRSKQPNLRLYSRHFLENAGKDEVTLTIAKDDEDYWLITETDLSLKITRKTYERLY